MTVGELNSLLNVFHHISSTDEILVQFDVDGLRKFVNLPDTYKVLVDGRLTPVIVPGAEETKPDTIDGRIKHISNNGDDWWMCSICGGVVDTQDNFCKHCGKQLNI